MDKKAIKLPEGRMCAKTLCRDCCWIDFDDPTKDPPYWYGCRRLTKYVDPEHDTGCEYWNVDD